MKHFAKIIIIVLIFVISLALVINYIFFNKNTAKKSKATGESVTLSFNPDRAVSGTGADFITLIKVKPSIDMTTRGYEFRVSFDKTKVQVKNIEYKLGVVSAGIGQDNTALNAINQTNGYVIIVGEIQVATGQILTASQFTDVLAITFTSLSTATSVIGIDATTVNFRKINADYDLISIPGADNIRYTVNPTSSGVTNTPNPSPTIAANTPTPNPTANPADTAPVTFNLKFQGITTRPAEARNIMRVKIKIEGTGLTTPIQLNEDFTANDQGVWINKNPIFLTNITSGTAAKYIVKIKGPKHMQKKFCEANPAETDVYSCSTPAISFQKGVMNNLDFKNIILSACDLPIEDDGSQSGACDALDYGYVVTKYNDQEYDIKCDLNLDGRCDTQDITIFNTANLTVPDEE